VGLGYWGWGIGDGGLRIGPNPHSPIPNPQSPIPNQNIILFFLIFNEVNIINKNLFILIKYF